MAEDGLHTGKIVVKSKNSQFKVTLPWRAHVLRGQLHLNDSCTHFHLPDDLDVDDEADEAAAAVRNRNVTVTNEFSVPVVVHNVTVPQDAAR